MGENFVLFSPRRLFETAAPQDAVSAVKAVAADLVMTEPSNNVASAPQEVPVDLGSTETATPDEAPSTASIDDRGPTVCDHALEIRHQTIRLAAIACGRALRHAVMLHPSVIAAFVDDALAAAGQPSQARVRVHPSCIEQVAALRHDRISDGSLLPGDVIVECGDARLGADIETRARLLVSAAAET